MRRILNLGGEGEVTGAINMNSMVATLRNPAWIRAHATPLVEADMLQPFPFNPESIDEVVGNRLPAFSPVERANIAAQSLLVLKRGGMIRIDNSLSGGTQTLTDAGFDAVSAQGRYLIGLKP